MPHLHLQQRASAGASVGQRAQLVHTPQGNVLWESLSLLDEPALEAVRARGGVSAMAVSHPHDYSAMVEWSHALGGAPIYIHESERPWVLQPDPAVVFWSGETKALPGGLTLIRCGGHFEVAQAAAGVHWPAGAGGRGALLAGDILFVASDRRWLSFMYSYPNLIPLNATAVRRIAAAVAPFAYDRIDTAWFDRTMLAGAREEMARSVARYLTAIAG